MSYKKSFALDQGQKDADGTNITADRSMDSVCLAHRAPESW
jgi:hypothetical protein